jgi:hypothetical protein
VLFTLPICGVCGLLAQCISITFVWSLCLAVFSASRGEVVCAFASMSGSEAQALEGSRNSVFTAALLKWISTDGHICDVRQVLAHVRDSVVTATARWPSPQVPWITASMGPAPQYIVQLGSCYPVSTLTPTVTVGSLVAPLLTRLAEQVWYRVSLHSASPRLSVLSCPFLSLPNLLWLLSACATVGRSSGRSSLLC